MLILPPGHHQQVEQQVRKRRPWRLGEKVLFWTGGLIVAGLVAAFLFSLTGQGHKSGHGCIDFSYLTVIGGGETYDCGKLARRLCITHIPTHVSDPQYFISLHKACREAGLPTAANPVTSS